VRHHGTIARMDENQRRRQFRFGLVSLFALVAAIGVLACFWNPIPNPSRNNFHLIKHGMTIADVTTLVGPPDTAHCDAATGRIGLTVHEFEITPGKTAYFVYYLDGKVTDVNFAIGPGPKYPPSSCAGR